MEVCEQDLVLSTWPCKASDFSDHDGAELMHRIRIKKKSKRKIRIKRRSAPRRIATSRVGVHKPGRRKSLSKAVRKPRPQSRKGRKIVVRKRRLQVSGRHAAKRTKQSTRDIYVFGPEGYQLVADPSPRQAPLSSAHLIAIHRFLRTRDTTWLRPFQGKRIAGIDLLTEPKRLREFADADLVKLDGLYRDQRGHGGRR
jgi:hypothetical protein